MYTRAVRSPFDPVAASAVPRGPTASTRVDLGVAGVVELRAAWGAQEAAGAPESSAAPEPPSAPGEIVHRPDPGLARGVWEAPPSMFYAAGALAVVVGVVYVLHRRGLVRFRRAPEEPPVRSERPRTIAPSHVPPSARGSIPPSSRGSVPPSARGSVPPSSHRKGS